MNIFENKFLQLILLPLSYIYYIIIQLRNFFYDKQIFKSFSLDCPVICVGNITVGGAGKTPVVEFLAKYFRQQFGLRVAILSRGYGRESAGTVIVSDGTNVLSNAKWAGDEPFLLANRLKSVPIVVDEDRVRGGQIICQKFHTDLILLDDGYQHRRLSRMMNLAVINGHVGFGNGRLLPAGPLREPISALNRAGILWFHQLDSAQKSVQINQVVGKFENLPKIFSDYQPKTLVSIPEKEEISLNLIKGKKIMALSGIANPERFHKTLRELCPEQLMILKFKDHYRFSEKDFDFIGQKSQKEGIDLVVTTEKDFYRLDQNLKLDNSFYFLKMELVVLEGIEHFTSILHPLPKS